MSSAGWPVAFSRPTESESESERPPQWPGPPTLLHPTAPRSRQWKPWHSSPPINTTHLHSLSSGVFTTSTSTTIIILTAVRAQRQLFRFSRDRFYVSAAGKRGGEQKARLTHLLAVRRHKNRTRFYPVMTVGQPGPHPAPQIPHVQVQSRRIELPRLVGFLQLMHNEHKEESWLWGFLRYSGVINFPSTIEV